MAPFNEKHTLHWPWVPETPVTRAHRGPRVRPDRRGCWNTVPAHLAPSAEEGPVSIGTEVAVTVASEPRGTQSDGKLPAHAV